MNLIEFCHVVFSWYDYEYSGAPRSRESNIVFISALLLWVVGILGNLANAVVFRHKDMAHRPMNLIFWWLSISDLLELAILASYQWYCGWCNDVETVNNGEYGYRSFHECVLILAHQYLFQVVHTVTIGINIVVVFYQYTVVTNPLIMNNKKNPFSHQSVKLAVIWIYVLSFALYLPFWFIHGVEERGYSYFDEQTNQTYTSWFIELKKDGPLPENPNTIDSRGLHPLVEIYILVCGVVLRIGLLLVLTALCCLLLFAVKNIHHKRQTLNIEAHHVSNSQRETIRMSTTIILIIIMFLLSEVPLGISNFLTMFHQKDKTCSVAINRSILPPFVVLNCCYNIFCYLIRIRQYRETLSLLLTKSNWVSSRTSMVGQTETATL